MSNGITLALTIVFVITPERLSHAISFAMASSVSKMFEMNKFVRKLNALETVASIDEICADMRSAITWADSSAVRPEVPAAIQKFKEAGINVRMVCSEEENPDEAKAIALQAGIVQREELDCSENSVMTGEQFRTAISG